MRLGLAMKALGQRPEDANLQFKAGDIQLLPASPRCSHPFLAVLTSTNVRADDHWCMSYLCGFSFYAQ